MKFSEQWLREWIKIKIKSDVLYDQIASCGIEVEDVNKFAPIFNNVFVGQIIKCVHHTSSNNLKVVTVDIGKKILNIVCGATNCRNGIKVAVAVIGAVLPNNIEIKKKLFKDIMSEGMLCSFFELGLFYSNQIIEFSENAPIGIDVYNYLSLQDNIIKTSTTSNRPDGLSILGLSRNILALNDIKMQSLQSPNIPVQIDDKISINIAFKKNYINCFARIIQNVNIHIDTPFWIKKRLFLSDISLQNVIKDILNYVLIELGQPINVLNADAIDDDVVVRSAHTTDSIFLPNQTIINLNKKYLVFSNKKRVLFIAGNINAKDVEIQNNTKNIFLISSLIDQETIRYILKDINITQSLDNNILEYYNCGIDPTVQEYAIEYATDLIIKVCGGKSGPITTSNNQKISNLLYDNKIRLYYDHLNSVMGFSIDIELVSNILYNLDYQVQFQKNYWDVIPPSCRFDILIAEDVIGDILRIYKYDSVPLNPLTESLQEIKKEEKINVLLDKFYIILINKGYQEVINYGFIDSKTHDIIFPHKKKLLLVNPVSKDMSCMRVSLWPGLLKNVSYNKNRQQNHMRFFESGLCFSINKDSDLGVTQEMFLSAVISGNYAKENWFSKNRKVDFYDLKGDLESILESVYNLEAIEFRPTIICGLHPKQSAAIYYKNNIIGNIGAIHPSLEKIFNVPIATFLFEMSLNIFVDSKEFKVQEISKFPTIRRDLSISISKDVLFSDLINECKKFFSDRTVEINLFDIYSVKDTSRNEKSLSISFIFQDIKKTLEENEINSIMNDCIGVLNKKFKVILRT
ncbi:phenylalanine--tRNA ligase subunit beta [Buchnera aphidicola (Hyadaphis tataricae)]|uniref:Phenylalanine--tRNA ligase beta subunit n=1 Tax=Buchnera aphidicola (Hyadaphis tataricae) TaxID=1241859 RepID=A0A4D6XVM7_9GAMM|nr:phenylalanine--tRNA ligase subunit beta [Buchnera aphidicola]QCI21446.1 phenylalanine--tRNA ligase subunit beta [Buchnera aphidicola (Hyadaphis tataricae)]